MNPITNIEKIEKSLYALGVSLYRVKSSYVKYNAQQNLQGRTHYVDDDTCRFFKSKILRATHSTNGLLFGLVESVGSKPSDMPGGNRRAVVFDVFGDVVNDRAIWHRTTDQAVKAMYAFLDGFDAESHTRTELVKRAVRDIKTQSEILGVLV